MRIEVQSIDCRVSITQNGEIKKQIIYLSCLYGQIHAFSHPLHHVHKYVILFVFSHLFSSFLSRERERERERTKTFFLILCTNNNIV